MNHGHVLPNPNGLLARCGGPACLDLFCGAGGMAVGYHRAGFRRIVGVDNRPMPRYPFEFRQGDALETLSAMIGSGEIAEFDMVPASPPCQGYSRMRHLPWLAGREWPLLIEETRARLERSGLTWVIENVEDAPLEGITLCGQSFGLKVYRHRRFASSHLLLAPPHRKHAEVIGHGRMLNDRAAPSATGMVSLPSKATRGTPLNGLRGTGDCDTVAGHFAGGDAAKRAMGIDWMSRAELAQAIPPAYGEFVGRQMLTAIGASS